MSDQSLLCDEKHKNLENTIDNLSQQTINNTERIDRLETNQVRTETIVTNLCKQIESLTKVLWWMIGLSITTGLGFIIWYIQSH